MTTSETLIQCYDVFIALWRGSSVSNMLATRLMRIWDTTLDQRGTPQLKRSMMTTAVGIAKPSKTDLGQNETSDIWKWNVSF